MARWESAWTLEKDAEAQGLARHSVHIRFCSPRISTLISPNEENIHFLYAKKQILSKNTNFTQISL